MLTDGSEHKVAKTLMDKLGRLPMAVRIAGSYIHASGLTSEQYLDMYTKDSSIMLEQHRSREWGDRKNSNATVLATWELSFAAIVQKAPKAAELLQLLAFLAKDDIWDDLLLLGYNIPKGGKLFHRVSRQIVCPAHNMNRCDH